MLRSLIARSEVALITFIFLAIANAAHAQFGLAYGVTGTGSLFRFDLDNPYQPVVIGQLGFTPEGLDFRPGTHRLYALDVGPATTQLYSIDVATAAAIPVGAGFPSTGPGYALLQSDTFGFDFNPKTLQLDDSMRIRVVSTSGANLRLNSSTGQLIAVDGTLHLAGTGPAPFIDAIAYSNNLPGASGATTLYALDSHTNTLYIQDPPNSGALTPVGPIGTTHDLRQNIGFDIFTRSPGVDPSTPNFGVVMLRPEADAFDAYGYNGINLATGNMFYNMYYIRQPVGPAGAPFETYFNFDGGFAVDPVPEPSTIALIAAGAIAQFAAGVRKRRRTPLTAWC